MIPAHLIADPLPSHEAEVAATFVLRTIRPASLWRIDDSDSSDIRCIKIFEILPEDISASEMANVAREVGEFWNQYCQEEDALES